MFASGCQSGNIPLAADWSCEKRIRGDEALIVASGENCLPVCHGGYLPACVRASHSVTVGVVLLVSIISSMNPQSTWVTLSLSRKPESNCSHMSVITVKSDETLMSVSVFPSLPLCVSFSLFLALSLPYCCPKEFSRPRLLFNPSFRIINHMKNTVYGLTSTVWISVFGIKISLWLRLNDTILLSFL